MTKDYQEKHVISQFEVSSCPGGVAWFESSFPHYKLNLDTMNYEFRKE